jgi:hypothetical protein
VRQPQNKTKKGEKEQISHPQHTMWGSKGTSWDVGVTETRVFSAKPPRYGWIMGPLTEVDRESSAVFSASIWDGVIWQDAYWHRWGLAGARARRCGHRDR